MSHFFLQEQACATCLVLACNQSLVERQVRSQFLIFIPTTRFQTFAPVLQVSDFATHAFFMYGGEPRHSLDSVPGSAAGPGAMYSSGMMTPGPGEHPLILTMTLPSCNGFIFHWQTSSHVRCPPLMATSPSSFSSPPVHMAVHMPASCLGARLSSQTV